MRRIDPGGVGARGRSAEASLEQAHARLSGTSAPSPALGDALNAEFGYLEVKCLGCNTHQTVALDIVRLRGGRANGENNARRPTSGNHHARAGWQDGLCEERVASASRSDARLQRRA